MWWPWFELEAARDPLLSGERELLSRVMAVTARGERRRLSLAELDRLLEVPAREHVEDVAPERAEVA
ncbi:hypothetical protein [Nostocoides sp. HKS02]|uniref:hypothetical protein n=1 Tax=Nostocoides sp. HKS02 TaxID=1813880 RepID=UPI0012B4CCED|nr:hypothetical protein [Tetrasphaera sp. HKS02]QGN57000.1 hypothetical protein GKE56_02825 [Tetrasphaera sp. HKS02]